MGGCSRAAHGWRDWRQIPWVTSRGRRYRRRPKAGRFAQMADRTVETYPRRARGPTKHVDAGGKKAWFAGSSRLWAEYPKAGKGDADACRFRSESCVNSAGCNSDCLSVTCRTAENSGGGDRPRLHRVVGVRREMLLMLVCAAVSGLQDRGGLRKEFEGGKDG